MTVARTPARSLSRTRPLRPGSPRRSSPPLRRDDPLAQLRNIGPAMRADLALLGIETLGQLAASEPDALYLALSRKTGRRQDPCVWDTFAAAIHQARSGEARNWWAFTPLRKQRQAAGDFVRDPWTLDAEGHGPAERAGQNDLSCASGSKRSARGRRAG